MYGDLECFEWRLLNEDLLAFGLLVRQIKKLKDCDEHFSNSLT